jgi:hypothetical protein
MSLIRVSMAAIGSVTDVSFIAQTLNIQPSTVEPTIHDLP